MKDNESQEVMKRRLQALENVVRDQCPDYLVQVEQEVAQWKQSQHVEELKKRNRKLRQEVETLREIVNKVQVHSNVGDGLGVMATVPQGWAARREVVVYRTMGL